MSIDDFDPERKDRLFGDSPPLAGSNIGADSNEAAQLDEDALRYADLVRRNSGRPLEPKDYKGIVFSPLVRSILDYKELPLKPFKNLTEPDTTPQFIESVEPTLGFRTHDERYSSGTRYTGTITGIEELSDRLDRYKPKVDNTQHVEYSPQGTKGARTDISPDEAVARLRYPELFETLDRLKAVSYGISPSSPRIDDGVRIDDGIIFSGTDATFLPEPEPIVVGQWQYTEAEGWTRVDTDLGDLYGNNPQKYKFESTLDEKMKRKEQDRLDGGLTRPVSDNLDDVDPSEIGNSQSE